MERHKDGQTGQYDFEESYGFETDTGQTGG